MSEFPDLSEKLRQALKQKENTLCTREQERQQTKIHEVVYRKNLLHRTISKFQKEGISPERVAYQHSEYGILVTIASLRGIDGADTVFLTEDNDIVVKSATYGELQHLSCFLTGKESHLCSQAVHAMNLFLED